MKSFFDYWDQIPYFIKMNEDQEKLLDQEIRGAIIDILAIGIEDKDPMTGKAKIRHVLSARELLEQLNHRLDDEIKKSNLYFHLQKLEDAGLIIAVDQIPHGKQSITYYGRTAKGFTKSNHFNEHEKTVVNTLNSEKMKEFMKKINSNLSNENIKQIVDRFTQIFDKQFDEQKIAPWLDKYHTELLDLELDVRRVFDIFMFLSHFDKETINAVHQLAELLDYPFDN